MEKELAKKLVAACTEFDVEATIREEIRNWWIFD